MARRKVTFVYETGRPLHGPIAQMMPHLEDHVRRLGGVDPPSIPAEAPPAPPIVEEFVVRITSPALLGPLRAHRGGEGLIGDILRGEFHVGRTVEVERRA